MVASVSLLFRKQILPFKSNKNPWSYGWKKIKKIATWIDLTWSKINPGTWHVEYLIKKMLPQLQKQYYKKTTIWKQGWFNFIELQPQLYTLVSWQIQ